ncbi:unnamed protein product, partial [Effrenium voratum]
MADAELRETKAFEDLLPETTQKCTMAEEAMEKAVATHETIAGAGADLDQAQKAVGDTEVAVKEAEKALGEARMVLQGKLNFARRFEAPKVRDNASQELNKMMAKLQTVQSKLMPLKTARHELAQRAAAQKTLKELQEKLTPLAQDVQAAESAQHAAEAEEATEEQKAAAEAATQKAGHQLEALWKLIAARRLRGGEVVAKELAPVEQSYKELEGKVKAIQDRKRLGEERVALEVAEKEAQERIQALQEAAAKAEEADASVVAVE